MRRYADRRVCDLAEVGLPPRIVEAQAVLEEENAQAALSANDGTGGVA
ncbi:MAG TPA: hypothetical protein VKB93_21795 [Thermoanaerobaculia bacterium]|nr:hypothetical protein [Thermoanaerobaculia bacterium]